MTTRRPDAPLDSQNVSLSELAEEVLRHKRAYYSGQPLISDQKFDRIEERLRALAPDHPVLRLVGTDSAAAATTKVPHATPMLSLQKTYDEAELLSWAEGQPLAGMWKIDGNSLSLVYKDGRLALAKTRGNGQIGEDVTAKALWVPEIPSTLPSALSCEIRGELYCSAASFLRLADTMEGFGLERPTSPRNIVAGMLGRKEHLELNRFFGFFAFDVLGDSASLSFATEMSKFPWLAGQGFAVPQPRLLTDQESIRTYLADVRSAMEEGSIGMDGAVFSYNDTSLHDRLGNTSHHPRSKMSFKWAGETARTRIAEVQWSTSRLGFVTPVAVVEPVFLSGATITNVTLHNASHVKAYNLKVGDEIEIIRSGEVIPKFLAVTVPASGTSEWPARCPSCGEPLFFDDVRLQCRAAETCPAQRMRSILNWISAAEIDDLSEKRLEQMMNLGLVQSIPDLYRLKLDDLLRLPQVKEKMATKLLRHIEQSRSLPLARFLRGLGIEGGGATTWEKLLETWPTLEELMFATAEDIARVDGFAEKSSRQITEGLADKAELIQDLLAAGVQPTTSASVRTDGPLTGKSIAITGALSCPRSEIEALIKAAGGHPSSSVSKSTWAVVTEDPLSSSSKMLKARELGLRIWSEKQLRAEIMGGEG